jgi:hypothetical protein
VPKAKKKKSREGEIDGSEASKKRKHAGGADGNEAGPVKEKKRKKKSEQEKEEGHNKVSAWLKRLPLLASSTLLFYTPRVLRLTLAGVRIPNRTPPLKNAQLRTQWQRKASRKPRPMLRKPRPQHSLFRLSYRPLVLLNASRPPTKVRYAIKT